MASEREQDLALAKALQQQWDDNEESMAEMAAYHVACEQLGIDPDDGWDLLALLAQDEGRMISHAD